MQKSQRDSDRKTGGAIDSKRSRKSLPKEQQEEQATPTANLLEKQMVIEKSDKGSNIEAANAAAAEENVNASEIDQPQ